MPKLVLVSLLICVGTLQGATLTPVPAGDVVTLEEMVAVAIVVTDVNDLYAFQFDVGFDPAILSVVGVSDGLFLGGGQLFWGLREYSRGDYLHLRFACRACRWQERFRDARAHSVPGSWVGDNSYFRFEPRFAQLFPDRHSGGPQ
jgi:Cohesin domain